MSIDIVPTVMPDSHDDFVEKIERVFHYVNTIQIDVMDGVFVPSKSWPYNSSDDSFWKEYVDGEEGLPHWENVNFEVDLMVSNQVEEAKKWISAGVMRVICHIEAFKEGDIEEFLKLKDEFGVEVYLALVPSTSILAIEPYLDSIDGVQFMGINRIGYQGQNFEEKVLGMIEELRGKKPELPISIDGGVNFETTRDLVEAGVTSLASGSLVFESVNPKETIE
jgi:ribulose-phosphate 3-epimerase